MVPQAQAPKGLNPQRLGVITVRTLLVIADATLGKRFESGAAFQERHPYFSDGTIALFSNNELGLTLQLRIVRLVDFFAENKHDQVGILLNRSRLAQVGELRTVIST